MRKSFQNGDGAAWVAAPDVLLDDQDGIHFNLRAFWQGGNADGGAGRVRLLEVLAQWP